MNIYLGCNMFYDSVGHIVQHFKITKSLECFQHNQKVQVCIVAEFIAFESLQNKNKTVKEIAKALGVGEATIYRYQRDLKKQGKLIWAK